MLTGTFNITIYQGQSWCEDLYVQDSNGSPVNLSGLTISGIIKQGYGVSGHLSFMDYEIVAANTGHLHLSLSATGTASMPATQGVYSVRAFSGESFFDEYLKGYINIYPDVFSIG